MDDKYSNAICVRAEEVDDDQVVSLDMFPILGKHVVAQCKHKLVTNGIERNLRNLKAGRREMLNHVYRRAEELSNAL